MPKRLEFSTPESILINRFINYYIIKWLWINQKRPVNELYLTFFRSETTGRGNKTLYDKILRQVDFDIESKVKDLEALTGLKKDYFLGKQAIRINGIINTDWEKYINLRKKSKGYNKPNEQVEMEKSIHNALLSMVNKPNGTSVEFQTILYYVKNLVKAKDNAIENKLKEITVQIKAFSKRDLESIEKSVLDEYFQSIKKHYEYVQAIITLRDWTK